ncbi:MULTISPECIES: hypothetical protein [Pandoraea]|uniref:Uncharacterized protein n=2 Tax=Pandoraea TaxID=93217 RepID=A0A5E4VA15_9BURK|nr:MULTISPECIES: hypothetical protein [Pandoraea]ALS61420.1 hypothetical protein AT302_18210 [Pandoraea norimbergensis]VVE09078.1 hypothetical protein PIN31115_02519 [Pandoraea iniqua]VVE16762.1 hypothetical protein PIN31009_02922 [Pandoraea iniqua]
MLSHHEFATLMLVKDAPEQVELDRPDLESLLDSKLIEWEELAPGVKSPRLTVQGKYVLQAVA